MVQEKQKSAEIFQKERESAGVERSIISRGFRKQRMDRGTSGRVLECLTVRTSRNSIFIQQSRLVLPSPLAAFLIALARLFAVVSLVVSAALLQAAYTQTETHMHAVRAHHRIASFQVQFS